MDYNQIPTTIRSQFEEDKLIHQENCNEGYIVHVNKFTLQINEEKCKYCLKFNKERFDDNI